MQKLHFPNATLYIRTICNQEKPMEQKQLFTKYAQQEIADVETALNTSLTTGLAASEVQMRQKSMG